MEIRQRLSLQKLLIPELTQSLSILALPHLEIKHLIERELESNPLLEEDEAKAPPLPKIRSESPRTSKSGIVGPDDDFQMAQITRKASLQDVLLRQLGMFTNTDEEFRIGEEIIGNIDDNGYLLAEVLEMAATLGVQPQDVEKVLKIVQQFEPFGVGARTISECLRIQLELNDEKDPVIIQIVECHLENVAKKNYCLIAKALDKPLEHIEPLIKRIQKLDPKPGRNYSLDETQHVAPDIQIQPKETEITITINNEDIPDLHISKTYAEMLQSEGIDAKTKDFLTEKIRSATELLRAISRRQTTLRRIVEVVVEIQQEAIRENLSCLKPLTFADVAKRIEMHESTVCRAVMNKYVQTPYGVVALKDFFPSRVHDNNGLDISSHSAKKVIVELIEAEDKKHPLSDQDIAGILSKEKNIALSRRTVTKYREELKILSSTFRKER